MIISRIRIEEYSTMRFRRGKPVSSSFEFYSIRKCSLFSILRKLICAVRDQQEQREKERDLCQFAKEREKLLLLFGLY